MTDDRNVFLEEKGLEFLDLTGITPSGATTYISIGDRHTKEATWIKCGAIEISSPNKGQRRVSARLAQGATDRGHDSAWAFKFDVIGLRFEAIQWGAAHFTGYLSTPLRDFEVLCVPQKGYDPFETAHECPHCNDKHPVVDFYAPENNLELHQKIAGSWIDIRIFEEE